MPGLPVGTPVGVREESVSVTPSVTGRLAVVHGDTLGETTTQTTQVDAPRLALSTHGGRTRR